MSRSAEATCQSAFDLSNETVPPAEPARRDCDQRSLVNTVGTATKFSIAFILGGSCWIGLETLAVNLLQYFTV